MNGWPFKSGTGVHFDRNTQRRHLFIDGAAFQYSLDYYSQQIFDTKLPIKWDILASRYDRVYFYDALPAKKRSESDTEYENRFAEKRDFHNSLSMRDKYHIGEGVSRHRRGSGNIQKAVDILLAVEALQQAQNGSMDEATFILSDLDFYPLLNALVQTRVKTSLIYDPTKTSEDLIHCADIATPLSGQMVLDWLDLGPEISVTPLRPVHMRIPAHISISHRVAEVSVQDRDFILYHAEDDEFFYAGLKDDIYATRSASRFIAIDSVQRRLALKANQLYDSFDTVVE